MKVKRSESVEQNAVQMAGAERCQVRWLIGSNDGAPNFSMREYEVEPGGFTPRHSHAYEHEVYVLAGQGIVVENDERHPIRSGDVVFVAPDEVHQFRNTGAELLRFLCLIPNSAVNTPITARPDCEAVKPECGCDC
jgi:quercetin dioxygenase-like cupin family protein